MQNSFLNESLNKIQSYFFSVDFTKILEFYFFFGSWLDFVSTHFIGLRICGIIEVNPVYLLLDSNELLFIVYYIVITYLFYWMFIKFKFFRGAFMVIGLGRLYQGLNNLLLIWCVVNAV